MSQKIHKKIRQLNRRFQRQNFQEFIDMLQTLKFWDRLKFCYRLMRNKKLK